MSIQLEGNIHMLSCLEDYYLEESHNWDSPGFDIYDMCKSELQILFLLIFSMVISFSR